MFHSMFGKVRNGKHFIASHMKQHYERVVSEYGEDRFMFMFVSGSQNYGLQHEGSDVDTKTFIAPTLRDTLLGKEMVSRTIVLDNNEHTDVKDYRQYLRCLWKQNINFVEVLFSEWYVGNPNEKIQDIFKLLTDNREEIAHYNPKATVDCLWGTAHQKYERLFTPHPNSKEKIEQYGYDGKELHHILRQEEFMKQYIKDIPYAECLITFPTYGRDLLMAAKLQPIPLEEVDALARQSLSEIDRLHDNFASGAVNTELRERIENEMAEMLATYLLYSYVKRL